MFDGTWLSTAVHVAARLPVFAACLSIGAGWCLAQDEAAPRRVLVLYSDDQRLPATNIVGRTVTETLLASPSPLIVYSDFLDLVRFQGEAYEESLARFIGGKHSATQLDLVVALGPPALNFIVKHRQTVAPEARIVFALVSHEEVHTFRSSTDQAVGVFSEYSVSKTIELAQGLQPDAKRVVVISGSTEFDKSWEQFTRDELASLGPGVEVTYLGDLAFDEVIEKVGQLPREAIVLVLSIFQDRTGRRFVPREAAREISRAAAAPTYSIYDTFVGRGVVGAYSDTFESTGIALSALALDTLAGKPEAAADRINEDRAFRVDAREMKRWKLSEANLPPGAIVLFDEETIWEQHWDLIVAALAVIFLQSGLLAGLLVQRARRRKAEAARAEAQRDAEMQRREVAHMSRVLVLGELSGAIAHELNQPLTAILANAQAAQLMLQRDRPDIDEALAALGEIVEDNNRAGEVIQRLRGLLKKDEGRWELIDVNDLMRSTLNLLHSELVNRRIDTVLELQPIVSPVRGDPVQLQQVALNLMINAMDALAANDQGRRQMVVRTRVTDRGMVELSVVDNGPGIPSAEAARIFQPFFTTKSHGLGLGLSICTSILAAHGGTLALSAGEEGGAEATVTLPAAELRAAAE